LSEHAAMWVSVWLKCQRNREITHLPVLSPSVSDICVNGRY
jgi:hypothetical protein